MKKKHLLNESEVRKMMKFANLRGLSDGFVEKIQEGHYGVDEELYEAEHEEDVEVGGAPMGDLDAADAEMPAGPDMGDMGDMDAGDESPEEIASAILQGALDAAEKYGVQGSIDKEGEDAMGDMSADPADDAAAEDDMGEMPEPGDEDDAPLEEMLDDAGFSLQEDEDVVNEVARRVAKRLMEMKRRA